MAYRVTAKTQLGFRGRWRSGRFFPKDQPVIIQDAEMTSAILEDPVLLVEAMPDADAADAEAAEVAAGPCVESEESGGSGGSDGSDESGGAGETGEEEGAAPPEGEAPMPEQETGPAAGPKPEVEEEQDAPGGSLARREPKRLHTPRSMDRKAKEGPAAPRQHRPEGE
ncbi:MAG TPA: hypothetical protein PLE61_15330 [Vicinamibacterales bacterium]|nr:hypothetical protein [Vicinamibacterales bacterium]